METIEYTWTETLKPATRADFIVKDQPKYGCVFFLKSMHTGKPDGPYLLHKDRNMLEFKNWLKNNMVMIRSIVK